MNKRLQLPGSLSSEMVQELMMGPSALLLTEELLNECSIKDGMRVLDLGCGRGISSMLIAHNYNLTLFAADLWIEAEENQERFTKFLPDKRIIPVHIDANNLPGPLEKKSFDRILSVDSYHYYGCSQGFLSAHLLPLLKTGGEFCIAVPGLQEEFRVGIPEELQPYWVDDMNFHSCSWWKSFLSRERGFKILAVKPLVSHDEAWSAWLATDNPYAVSDRGFIRADGGRYLNTIMIHGRKLGF